MKNLKYLFLLLAVGMFMACNNENASSDGQSSDEATNEMATNAAQAATNAANPADMINQAAEVPTGPTTTIEFESSTYDFGEVMDGENVRYAYKFKNTGSEPLIISNAKGSCGCTVPDWPREPIPVGGSSEVMVEFNTKGKGSTDGRKQTKRVTITANTEPVNTFLTITGVVKKEDAGTSAQ